MPWFLEFPNFQEPPVNHPNIFQKRPISGESQESHNSKRYPKDGIFGTHI